MDIIDKNNKRNKPKSRRLWLVFVTIPIAVIILLSLTILGLYILKKSVNPGVEKGLVYANSNMNNKAIREFKKALAKNPNDAIAHYYMSSSYMRLKEYDKAIAELRETLKIDPDFYEARIQLAIINIRISRELKKQRKTKSQALEKLINAEKICEKIIESNPDLMRAHTLLAEIYLTKGLTKDAIKKYKDAIQLNNSFEDVRIALARLYMHEGKIDLAKEQCEITLSKIDPDNYQMQILLSTIYIQQGKLNKAIARLKRVLEKRPNDIRVHTQLGMLYLQTLKYKDALNEAEKVFKLALPASVPPPAYFIKGSVLLQRKDYINAITHLKQATIKLPNMIQAHFFLGLALAASGRTEQAISEFNTAIKIDPGFVPAQIGLLRLLAREGSLKETIDLSKNVLKIEPENAEAKQILSLANKKKVNLKISNKKSKANAFKTNEIEENESIFSSTLTFGNKIDDFKTDNELSMIKALQINAKGNRKLILISSFEIESINQIYEDYVTNAFYRNGEAFFSETTTSSCILNETFNLFEGINGCGFNPVCLIDISLDTAINLTGCFFNSK